MSSDSFYDPAIHHRRSIRLPDYEYSQAGLYFVTICVKDRQCLFGRIDGGQMVLNEVGEIACQEWGKSAEIRQEIVLHEFIIMPNHMHGIVEITDITCRGDWQVAQAITIDPDQTNRSAGNQGDLPIAPTGLNPKSLGAMIGGYKASVTKKVNDIQQTSGSVWQRNYYEHIIRNARSHQQIAEYITTNPQRWEQDTLYVF
ncbi:hypothetical protein QNI19_08090 [Cytophagaceae bacterium DM2B3-1]|uniref:Transposase IS200-like domain-containing protein n=1 Tax=Xanthocytophaga flava TaxID=3048013 RepID=A0ABT7CGL2_9BACT|nr:transposase [Xanthocytophaga flavus]MDJ1471127.1 hypothetical protein [Xanthocytophaga flavus]MDJ1492887.1 hypothetical protein [Xanthocytophaga flavus]